MIQLTFQFDKKPENSIKWSEQKQAYVYRSNNKKLTERQLYRIVATAQQRYTRKQERLAKKLVSGGMSFGEWQRKSLEVVKESHVQMTRLARGGKEQTYAIHYLNAAKELKQIHYPAHRRFASEIAEGKLSKKQIVARAKLYGQSTKTSFEKQRAKNYSKRVLVKRHLGSCSPHCDDCLRYASWGWVGLDRYVPPGVACQCRANCCCTAEFKTDENSMLAS